MSFANLKYSDLINENASLNDSLLAWWMALPENDYYGTSTLKDLTGNYNLNLANGADYLAPTWTTTNARTGGHGSLSFAGSHGVLIGSPAALTLNRNFSLSAWVRPSTAGTLGILTHGDTEWYLRLANSGGNKVQFLDSNAALILTSNGIIGSVNAWAHVAVTITTAGLVTIYINGVADGSTTTAAVLNDGAQHAFIGMDNPGFASEGFQGLIDDVRIVGRAYSADEMAGLYSAGLSEYRSELNRLATTKRHRRLIVLGSNRRVSGGPIIFRRKRRR